MDREGYGRLAASIGVCDFDKLSGIVRDVQR